MFGWLDQVWNSLSKKPHILACFFQHFLILQKYLLVKTHFPDCLVAWYFWQSSEKVWSFVNCLVRTHETQDSLLNKYRQDNSDAQKHHLSSSKTTLVTLSWLTILHWRNHKMCKMSGKAKATSLHSLHQECCLQAAPMATAGLWQNRDLKLPFCKALNYMIKGMAAGLALLLLLLQHKNEFKQFLNYF